MSLLNFIVLASGRSGSTLLTNYLSSHPSIHCHHEPFRENSWHPDLRCYDNPFDALNHISEHGLSVSNYQRLVSYVQSIVKKNTGNTLVLPFKSLPKDGCEGFKITWWQADELMKSAFSNWLSKQTQLKVILLSRNNSLARFVSYELAKKTGIWHATSPVKNSIQLYVDPEKLTAFHQLQDKQKKSLNAVLQENNINSISVSYENLVANHKAIMDEIFVFLETVPCQNLLQPTTKLIRPPLQDIISNYNELEQQGLI